LKKSIALFGVVLLFIIIQSTFFTIVNFGALLDVALLFVINAALISNPVYGGTLGLLTGLFRDVVYGDIVGIYGLSWMLIGTGVGAVSKSLFRSNYVIVFAITILATLFNYMTAFLMLLLLSVPVSFRWSISAIFLTSLLNAVMALPVHSWVKKIDGNRLTG
jgi:rod shape-determining protein MreD